MEEWVIGPRLYNCYKCGNMICRHDDIVSKTFQEDRRLITGLHTVADVYCCDCGERLGWRYIKAYEEMYKYKEGKIVLEKFKLANENNW
ncbi:Yippee-like protein [Corchorus capsularis]|uniref:Yippee-like protein n=1 Tax=Corchorus capsularis TaxID=210143 RepID=A0A1R3H1T6_COCAP|nr:Yippee-like protein [Corchorus capsularis]